MACSQWPSVSEAHGDIKQHRKALQCDVQGGGDLQRHDHVTRLIHKLQPITRCASAIACDVSVGNGARIYKPDFFEVPTDFWLALYWTMLCGMLIYLLSYGARALLILRQDPRVAEDRQHLPRRIGQRHPRLRRADHHRLGAIAAVDRGRHAGVDLRLRMWRRIRPYLGTVLAHQDQVVQHRQ